MTYPLDLKIVLFADLFLFAEMKTSLKSLECLTSVSEETYLWQKIMEEFYIKSVLGSSEIMVYKLISLFGSKKVLYDYSNIFVTCFSLQYLQDALFTVAIALICVLEWLINDA